jgi:hypothetical protein
MLTWNWKKMFETQPRKRALAKSTRLSLCAAEGLEERAMMSAVMDNGAEVAEVSPVEARKASVSYPNVSGNWLFTVNIPGMTSFSNVEVQIKQKGAKYFASGTVSGIHFEINGKFSKSNPTSSTGKGFFDNIPGVGNVKGSYQGSANQAGSSITGNAIVKVAGQTVSINLSGTK